VEGLILALELVGQMESLRQQLIWLLSCCGLEKQGPLHTLTFTHPTRSLPWAHFSLPVIPVPKAILLHIHLSRDQGEHYKIR